MDKQSPQPPSFWKSPSGVALAVAGSVGGFLLYQEHQAHFWGAFPYLILLACPVMHFFMHRGHGHGGGHRSSLHENRHDERR